MALEKEDIMALIAILQKGLTDDEPGLEYTEEAPVKTKTKKKRSVAKPKSQVRPNKFDEMNEKEMHKTDSQTDKKLWGNNRPTRRTRPPSMAEARCRVCGKTETVSFALAEAGDRYKCNKCATTSG